ncbi:putative uncharacterized protein DDB_G0290521 [Zingiber officinale]|uniref:putative uncharacterized protein DDB_G0290521 n=1 Tax=Zingiber officinale TaxID=94328 RepID=UPI001C4AB8C2|nr:putative uncharacterized protein DDB_G0290521 [Zingiber officinale]
MPPLLLGVGLSYHLKSLTRMISRCLRDFSAEPPPPPPLVPDSGPSAVSPPPPTATPASPSPPIATPTPAPSRVDVSPNPSTVSVEPPLAQPSLLEVQVDPPLVQPATSQQPQCAEAGPSQHPSLATSPPDPSPVPPSAPSGSAARPSNSAAGPSQSPLPVPLYYRTTTSSEAGLQSRCDVPTSSLTMKGRLTTVWEENVSPMSQACAEFLTINQSFHVIHRQNKMLQDKVTKLELQLNNPTQASYALRAEVKALTKKKNSLEVSLTISDQKLKDLKEEKSQVEVVHQQLMDQQALEHQ